MGYHPKVTFLVVGPVGSRCPAICAGLEPPAWAAFPCSPLALSRLNLEILHGQQKTPLPRPGAVRIKCSEGLGAQGIRKNAVLVCSEGTVVCSQ